jgi:hypothetical protein
MQLIQITQATLSTTSALIPKLAIELENFIGNELLKITGGICSVEIKQVKMFKLVDGNSKSIQGSILNLQSNESVLTTEKVMELQKILRKKSSLEKVKVLLKK